jgi:membrane fusion protein (multidrug efflux system)
MSNFDHTPRLACIALAAAVLGGCSARSAPVAKTTEPEVSVLTVHRSSVPAIVQLPGRTSPYLIAQVRARVDGIVQKRVFEEGTEVKANQLLYQIDPAPYIAERDAAAAALQKAQASLATTTAQLERYDALVGSNAISKQVYDNAVAAKRQAAADVASAQAQLRAAQIKLDYTRVTSPIAGRSGTSEVTQGAYVQASAATLMTSVQQIDPIYVDLRQSSVDALKLRQGVQGASAGNGAASVKVNLILEDGSRYALPGKLEFTGTTVDTATGSVTMRAVFPNPKHVLLPGMFVRAELAQGADENAMLVPVRAIDHDSQGQATALVVKPDKTVERRTVDAARIVGDNWVVRTGLNDGEQVVLAGGNKLQPGAHVRPVLEPAQPQQPQQPQQPLQAPSVAAR